MLKWNDELLERVTFNMAWDMGESLLNSAYKSVGKVNGLLFPVGYPCIPEKPVVNEAKEKAWAEYCTPKARKERKIQARKHAEKMAKKAELKRLEAEDFARTMLHIYSPNEIYNPKIHGIIENEIEEDWDY